jgi:hypothetical protein
VLASSNTAKVAAGRASNQVHAICQSITGTVCVSLVCTERIRGRVFRIGVARVERQAHRTSLRTTHQGADAEGRLVTVDNCAVGEIHHLCVGDRIDKFPCGNSTGARRTHFKELTERGGQPHSAFQEIAKKNLP